MLRFLVEHKYCKCRRVIEGYNVFDAFKRNETDLATWVVIDVEEI